MPVISIREYLARPIVEQLEYLLAEAKQGRYTGFAFAMKEGPYDHGIGLCGDYRDDPAQVLAVTARINYRINQMLDETDDSGSRPMAL